MHSQLEKSQCLLISLITLVVSAVGAKNFNDCSYIDYVLCYLSYALLVTVGFQDEII
jgi:hypothetical protein